MEDKICKRINGQDVCIINYPHMNPRQLPKIIWKGQEFTFDSRLGELREKTKQGMNFHKLNHGDVELLEWGIKHKDPEQIDIVIDEVIGNEVADAFYDEDLRKLEELTGIKANSLSDFENKYSNRRFD